jgi:hypothetical protein
VLFARKAATWSVGEISIQSSGYYPDPDSWHADAVTLDRLGMAHSGGLTHKMVFRHYPACGQLNIVGDGNFACSVCDDTLPRTGTSARPEFVAYEDLCTERPPEREVLLVRRALCWVLAVRRQTGRK